MNNKQLLILVTVIFLSIVSWIGFDIYHASNTSSVSAAQEEQTKPLTPQFDSAIIEKIKSRQR